MIASHPRRQQFRRLLGVAGAGSRSGHRDDRGRMDRRRRLRPAPLALTLCAGNLAASVPRNLKISRRKRVGADSEAEVRRALQPLAREGWSVRHGVRVRTGGDLDHVLRAPSGIGFVIETKTARYTQAHAARTIHAARWLARRRWRYPGGVVAVLCIARARHVERDRVRRAARRLARPPPACAARAAPTDRRRLNLAARCCKIAGRATERPRVESSS